MRRPEFTRTTIFRWTLASAGAFISAVLLIFGFIYWQTVGTLMRQLDTLLLADSRSFAAQAPNGMIERISQHIANDSRRIRLDGLFEADGRLIVGNIAFVPPKLPLTNSVGWATVVRRDPDGEREAATIRLAVRQTAGGRLLLVGRNADEIDEISAIVTRALLLGLIPAMLLSLALSAAVSGRTVRRLAAIRAASHAIMAGRLDRRLPTTGQGDDVDALAGIVNTMLGEIERLMLEVKTAGDGIAHDLRTPLTRLHGRLERARRQLLPGDAAARDMLDEGLGELDALLATMAALLRIGEIEHGARRAGFSGFDLREVVHEVAELYEPVAEDHDILLSVEAGTDSRVHGDRDLLFELLTNLVDNAIKFLNPQGRVWISLRVATRGPILRVEDDGPGIPIAERTAVLRRFHRGDRSRSSTDGSGLGLSLVAAIARLHDFRLLIETRDGGGCSVTIECWRAA